MKTKYEYLLKIWGGSIQELGLEDQLSYQWFNTKEERDKELERIKTLTTTSRNKGWAFSVSEGILTRHKFTIKSLILYKEELYWVYNDLGYGFYDSKELEDNIQEYMIDNKWGICTPNDKDGNEIDLYSEEVLLLNTSLIIEEPNDL